VIIISDNDEGESVIVSDNDEDNDALDLVSDAVGCVLRNLKPPNFHQSCKLYARMILCKS